MQPNDTLTAVRWTVADIKPLLSQARIPNTDANVLAFARSKAFRDMVDQSIHLSTRLLNEAIDAWTKERAEVAQTKLKEVI